MLGARSVEHPLRSRIVAGSDAEVFRRCIHSPIAGIDNRKCGSVCVGLRWRWFVGDAVLANLYVERTSTVMEFRSMSHQHHRRNDFIDATTSPRTSTH